ncbi:flavin reductase like domain-containing protein [Aspergillus ambiguus]|uniref:flavin reductase family protein n=1 Tax=Aspergillus ambiguus TaxID=176160 RepID=UPI003CCD4DF4
MPLTLHLHPDRTTTPSILSTPPPCPAQWHSHRPFSKATAPAVPAQATTPPTPTTHPDNPDAASLSDQVRLLMRRVPYPVAIITATDPHAETPAYRGMTVSSLNTVTLHPDPVVSFNVKRPSETLTALQSSGCFLVHLLAPGRATAALARDFARGNHHLTIVGDEGGDFEFVPLPPAPSPGEGPLHPRPLPLLRRKRDADCAAEADAAGIVSRDFPFVFECRLHPHSVRVHDHTIVVGTVVRALHGCNAETTSAADLCLTYANTRFWAMGHEI